MPDGDPYVSQLLDSLLSPASPQPGQRWGPIEEAARPVVIASLARSLQKEGRRLWLEVANPRHRNRLEEELSSFPGPKPLSLPAPELQNDTTLGPGGDWQLALHQLAADHAQAPVLLPPSAWQSSAPRPDTLREAALELSPDLTLDPADLEARLLALDFEKVPQVHARLQFARRGGILDLFPPNTTHPIRLEFFDDTLESLREFDLHSQTTIKRLDHVRLQLETPDSASLLVDWLAPGDLVLRCEDSEEEPPEHPPALLLSDAPTGHDLTLPALALPFAALDSGDFVMHDFQRDAVLRQMRHWLDEGWDLVVASANEGEHHRFHELSQQQFAKDDELVSWRRWLPRGFILPEKKVAFLSLSELFGRYNKPARLSELDKQRAQSTRLEVEELREEDLVIHAEYGLGRFEGIEYDEEGREELILRYRDEAAVHVPLSHAHLVARYIGTGGATPELSKLGSAKWKKTKAEAEKAIRDYAARLLKVQAERETVPGHAHPPDSKWMWDFENAFPYTETPDQLSAISATKADMEAPQPMDRLICGDVGFGKTEVAIRAAFKAVTGGSQAVMLCPTTVLAEQHHRNFCARMSEFPITIHLLNRFRKPAEVRETLQGLANGSVDIVIGTHRLLSPDLQYKNLGLVVVDEEQRFGVKHKEALKERFRQIDVLTLSATPIPRTLYFSLMGVRDMSTIDTAPPNRNPVKTEIHAYDERIIKKAIENELARGGQVYFLHNRVGTIEHMRDRIQELVPKAKIVIGHGQMDKDELEVVMHKFVDGQADILLATTIIESGIDIPNANTILIDRADRFGLADLYQLRGRVGRSDRQAYAFLFLPREAVAGGDSRKRLNAIRQYTALGSGFRIAMRDLEIRGAGSLLGTKQSGHMAAIGFDLYCQLLKQSVEELQGKKQTRPADLVLRADILSFTEGRYEKGQLPAYLPAAYIPEAKERVAAYRALATLGNPAELTALGDQWRDRYGRLPKPAKNLLLATRLRLAGAALGADLLEIKEKRLIVQKNGGYLSGNTFPRLKAKSAERQIEEAIDLLNTMV
ncbi:transcription-repair coupling factor [Roseibacillus ishigakijimensis]|uniref:Transcription-repair-coupling factor n=1 Tax=Roseibacillus ishigakijimensis TaxID=454146 RepID=A0A934VNQ4_9BACT|nr:transcription-repair coupling factor [Roseibacillus ishigakijimensis]MBK1835562.1 transcription-repair coupling factor [Roseibacillus ishigakijimensis]